MKLPARAMIAAGCLLLGGTGLAVATAPAAYAAATRPAHAGHASVYRVLVSCRGKDLVQPRSYVIACADGNDYLTKLIWTSWSTTSFASGWERINDCTPNCAGGTFHSYPVLVVLWQDRPRPHTHAQRYAQMTIIYSGTVPQGLGVSRTISLPAT